MGRSKVEADALRGDQGNNKRQCMYMGISCISIYPYSKIVF